MSPVTAIDHVRAIPARWWAGGAGGAVVAVLIVVATAAGGGSDIATTDPTVSVTASPADVTTTVRPPRPTTTVAATTTVPPRRSVTSTTIDLETEYELDFDEDDPAVSARPIPADPPEDELPTVTIAPPSWAASTFITPGGHVSTDVGCADDLSTAALDRFFAARLGPVLGWDYQHVYPLGAERYLWIFQDAFVDHSGTATTLGSSRFVHNAALVQSGSCFSLLHRGTTDRPRPFEEGDGTGSTRSKWYWPMGGELVDGQLWVFWAEMVKDPYDPDPPDGLGWHPSRTLLAAYDAVTLERIAFFPAPNQGVAPIYGYAVGSDRTHTYLFGNTFEQNLRAGRRILERPALGDRDVARPGSER